ncbi:MAG: hypothetical protein JW986_09370 [Methanotrichaceae archaeon]|nr:hypothetical protein [Methanotrichaceae archaeon]
MIEVNVSTTVFPTEKVNRATMAVERIFPGLTLDIREDRIEGYGGLEALLCFHQLLREQLILDAARSVMIQGRRGDFVEFILGKQAAFVGKVSFPPQEEPLGSIHVRISGGDQLVDWLAPRTEMGKPVAEIELLKNERMEDHDQFLI